MGMRGGKRWPYLDMGEEMDNSLEEGNTNTAILESVKTK